MFFRVTNSGMANRALTNAQIQLRRIDRSHRNISTGVRIHRPSDDPLAQRSVLSQRTITNRLEADLSNVTHAKTLMNVGVSRLINIKDVLVQARTIAQDGIQSSERELLGGRIEVIAEQIRESANTLFDGHYMFGGADTLKPPFVDDGAGGFAYQGSEYRTQTVIGVNLSIDVLYSGNEIFQNSARSPTVYQGETGAQPGTATDNGVGRATLTVRHTATSFVAGSGIANGTSATAQNTAIGTFSLQINDTSGTGANGTISLSGGPPVNFQSTDTDLRLKGPNGEILFLDTTSITPGFSGTIQVTADGTLSVDGGQSEVPITFANNQAVSHAETGTVTYVNSQQIIQAGTEFLDYRGTSDVFATLQFSGRRPRQRQPVGIRY